MTYDLFSKDNNDAESCIKLNMQNADVRLYPSFFSACEADALMSALKSEINWKQEKIKIYGQVHDLPRLTAWYGEPNKKYKYSGIIVESDPWTLTLQKIKDRIEKFAAVKFNSVLLNLYRTGSDSVAWHSDDEPELGKNPSIGSITFGEARPFQLKYKTNKDIKEQIILNHGSFLLMQGETQHFWLHQIPKSQKNMGERINLTFRLVE